MASAEMPLMLDASMDAAMDVDMGVNVNNALNDVDHQMPANFDLFGDPLRPATASKQLLQRLDELRTRGCCQYASPSIYPLTHPSPHHRRLPLIPLTVSSRLCRQGCRLVAAGHYSLRREGRPFYRPALPSLPSRDRHVGSG